MEVVGGGVDEVVGVAVIILAVHALVVRAGDGMPQMADDAVGEEGLAVLVEVEAPGVGGAVADDFKGLAGRVIAPDAAVEGGALVVGSAGPADARLGQDAVAAVQPAVRPPGQAVEHIVAGTQAPAVEDHLGLAGDSVAEGDEEQVRGAAGPDAAVADLDAGQVVGLVPEDGTLVKGAVAVGILENEDAVLSLAVGRPLGIGEALGHPEPAAVVEGQGNRLADLRLAGEEGDVEAWRRLEGAHGLLRRRRHVLGILSVPDAGRQSLVLRRGHRKVANQGRE